MARFHVKVAAKNHPKEAASYDEMVAIAGEAKSFSPVSLVGGKESL